MALVLKGVLTEMSNFTPEQVRRLSHVSARYGYSYDEVGAAMQELMSIEHSFDAAYGRLQILAGNAMQLEASLKDRAERTVEFERLFNR